MIELKKINYTDGSSVDVETIIENLQTLADEIDASRTKKNVIPTGFGSFSCPVEFRGTYDVIPHGHPRLDVRSVHCVLADNIKRGVKVTLHIDEKKIAAIKFSASERSGKMQVFELPDDLDLGTNYALRARTSDDRRLIVTANAASVEVR